jgi:hypothetical protein
MTDRELLEAAAKAAGLPHKWIPSLQMMLHIIDAGRSEKWNPLHDDGDALRLAVMTHLEVVMGKGRATAKTPDHPFAFVEELGLDDRAATRRAIVRAAAEIGRSMA